MPPKEKLSDAVIADFEAWVKMGAPDPRTGKQGGILKSEADRAKAKAHWSFQPVKKPEVPQTKLNLKKWVQNPVDSFILAKLEEKRMIPSFPADKVTLIRRAYFDLVGFPLLRPMWRHLSPMTLPRPLPRWSMGCLTHRIMGSAGAGIGWIWLVTRTPGAATTITWDRIGSSTPLPIGTMSSMRLTGTNPTTNSWSNKSRLTKSPATTKGAGGHGIFHPRTSGCQHAGHH